ncbi:MAG: formylglycine-generating enzyme family protein, partial [Bacteroidales bacterium]|nr:formylglycine-generating enzyme family protein [Bacteroidales bacterium]
FSPEVGDLNVTLPDNAWEMGYCSLQVSDSNSVCALARRKSVENGRKRRFKTIIYPNGVMNYEIYIDQFSGNWQNGLKLMFQERWIYDMDTFDKTLYDRTDQEWIRSSYLILLQFAWDHKFYEHIPGEYKIEQFFDDIVWLGNYDVYGLWPTWPRLGLDQRNQWDLYRELPGGLDRLRQLSGFLHSNGTAFFIAYNPWDQSTRNEDHISGMVSVIEELDADGVILDTRGKSNDQLQKAADNIKPGVIMYSEGMAVPEDMPGIISGRVHDAIYFQPVLNLNKLIKPDFAIFRVCQLSQGRIHRECAISFFNGYGTEINTFAPGRPEWMEEDFQFLGKTLKILRDNTDVFTSFDFTPLIPSGIDSIWINEWKNPGKRIFTILSLNPYGCYGIFFSFYQNDGTHLIDLWNHEEAATSTVGDITQIMVSIPPFPSEFTGSRNEGEVGCFAEFRKLIDLKYNYDTLKLSVKKGNRIKLWKGDPDYSKTPVLIYSPDTILKLSDCLGRHEGKVVIQLFDNNIQLDERIIYRKEGKPVLISKREKTKFNEENLEDMQLIPAGEFVYYATSPASFIPYPANSDSIRIKIEDFYMDTYPVTNEQYFDFLKESGYLPKDTANFLRHWPNGEYLAEDKNKPVVYINYEDAKAYADWHGKRIPVEFEWQYAAQGTDGRGWPWGNDFDSTFCNYKSGVLSEVSMFPQGMSPFGLEDITGNIWQMTDDLYDNGSYNFRIIQGGSYYAPSSSWWYVQGGPQPVNHRQMWLLVGSGFDRNATVGFRCVMDSE